MLAPNLFHCHVSLFCINMYSSWDGGRVRIVTKQGLHYICPNAGGFFVVVVVLFWFCFQFCIYCVAEDG